MSAQDNLSPQQFYHGTRSHLEEGDLIEPGRALAQPSSQPTGHVFATTDMHDAAGLSIRTKSPLRVQGLAAMEYYGSIPFHSRGRGVINGLP